MTNTNIHDLKTWPEPFQQVWLGNKTFEYRKDDRESRYEIEDCLKLREWDPEAGGFSGRVVMAIVRYIARGPAFGIPEGYCVMSIMTLCRLADGKTVRT